jgi:hypothetical protein
MQVHNPSAYSRLEIEIADHAALDPVQSRAVRARYGDGFIVYLNGNEAASASTAAHSDGAAIQIRPLRSNAC